MRSTRCAANSTTRPGSRPPQTTYTRSSKAVFRPASIPYRRISKPCPPKLHGYSYTGKIYPQEKDTLTYIGQNLIINIDDQLKALNKRDENELKNLITCPMVKYRMPYDMGEALKKAGYIKVSRRRNGGRPLYVYKVRKILPCPILRSCSSSM